MLTSLRAKVGITYLVLIALTAAVAFFASGRLLRLTQTVQTVLRDDVGAVVALQNLLRELDRQDDALRTLAAAGTGPAADSARAAFERAEAQFGAWSIEAEGRLVEPADLAALDSLHAAYAYYLRAAHDIVRPAGSPRADVPGAAPPRAVPRQAATAEASARNAFVRAGVARLLDGRARAVETARLAANADARQSARLVLSVAALAFGVGLLLSVYFARRVVAPIELLTRSVRGVGQGRQRQAVEIRSNDELAVLGREFNRMTERIDAYEAMNVQKLLAEKRTTEALVEAMPSPLMVADDAGEIVLLNDAARALAEAPPTPSGDRAPLPGAPLAGAPLAGAPLAGVRLPSAVLAAAFPAHADDALVEIGEGAAARTFRVRRRRVDEAGLTVALLEDVTHFARLDRMKSDFLAAVSHELRTPLLSLGLAVDLLRAGPVADGQDDLLATAKDDHGRLKRLVDGLIALARMDAGPYAPPDTPVAVGAVVDEALASLRLPFREKGVALHVEVPQGLPPVRGDAQHLGWVVTNLAANALRHTPAGGTVTVAARAADASLVLTVADTGSGIPADQLDAVFGAFVQLKDRNAATPGSLGLGLALARRIVDAHGGRVWAESTLGQGSTFVVTLPAATP